MVHQVLSGSLSASIDPPITVSVTSAPIERSKPPADQHEQLAGRQDRQRRGAAQEIHEAGRLEIGRLEKADDRIEDDEDDHRDVDAPRDGDRARVRGQPSPRRRRHATCSRVRAA